MHGSGSAPVRPVAIQGEPGLQQFLEIMRQGGRNSAFSTLGPHAQPVNPSFPEFNLYHAAQLSGLLTNNPPGPHAPHNLHPLAPPSQLGAEPLSQLAQLHQLQALQNQANLQNQQASLQNQANLLTNGPGNLPQEINGRAGSQSRGGGSRNEKSSTAYASRHQAAEQRRRNRINDRLDLLRKVVPHSERANTATFLEEVIKYVGDLQTRITALETAQGLPLTCIPKQGMAQALNELTQPSQKVLQVGTASQVTPSGISNLASVFPESNVHTSNHAQSTLQKDGNDSPSHSTEVEGRSQETKVAILKTEENEEREAKRPRIPKSEPA